MIKSEWKVLSENFWESWILTTLGVSFWKKKYYNPWKTNLPRIYKPINRFVLQISRLISIWLEYCLLMSWEQIQRLKLPKYWNYLLIVQHWINSFRLIRNFTTIDSLRNLWKESVFRSFCNQETSICTLKLPSC